MAAHQAPPSLGFSRQKYWSGLPFPSPMHEWKVKVKSLSCVWLLATPWTAAYQASPPMGFSMQQYWCGLPLLLLGIHTEETRIERDTCTPVFITALCTIARTWKQPRCWSADKWIRKLWYIYTMEYYSAIKKNAFESVLIRWMNWSLLYRAN